MESVFLGEYEHRERDAIAQDRIISDRLGKLITPVCRVGQSCPSIWSQVSFSGTLIFPLHAVPQYFFEQTWHISPNEIPEIIQFIKDTKKIQFVLTNFPLAYKPFDYLEPILQEFTPPYWSVGFPSKDKKTMDSHCVKYFQEIEHLIPLSPEWTSCKNSVSGYYQLKGDIDSYCLLRYFGFNEIADTFVDNFLIDPHFCHTYISMAHDMLVNPIIDPLRANPIYNLASLQEANKMGFPTQLSQTNKTFPEVGSFLMRKCTHYPESLEACKRLIDRYEDNDLYKVHSALNVAVIDRDNNSIIQKRDEMNEILDNVWNDTDLKSNATTYRYGIDMTCGIIGYALGEASGFLGSVIPELINSTNSHYLDQFSELIAKQVATPYMATIYDFKRKYSI